MICIGSGQSGDCGSKTKLVTGQLDYMTKDKKNPINRLTFSQVSTVCISYRLCSACGVIISKICSCKFVI